MLHFGILAMSPENATCERAFSVMKYIKNDQRSCLTQLHLGYALRIALEDRNFLLNKYYCIGAHLITNICTIQ